jgi:hypothetical protein
VVVNVPFSCRRCNGVDAGTRTTNTSRCGASSQAVFQFAEGSHGNRKPVNQYGVQGYKQKPYVNHVYESN